jgi:GR25 family glycosyltransferase involved in LPS biosynthesis
MIFHIFVVHTQKLTVRALQLHGVIQTIRTAAQAVGFDNVKPTMVLKPDPADFAPVDIEILNKRLNYEKVGDDIFDHAIQPMGLEQLSNFEKQREIWRRIGDHPEDTADVFMVIEDDAFILPECSDKLQEILKAIYEKSAGSYDLLTLCLADNDVAPSDPVKFLDFRTTGKVLPSKDAYFIRPGAAKLLYRETDIMKMTARMQMSYILHKNPSIELRYPNKRAMIEGSKLGITSSTINPSNILIYNREFMDMWKYINVQKPPIREIRNLYKKVEHVKNPDMMHIYAVLLYRAGELHEAQDAFMEAVEIMKEKQGLLTSRSELLNNAINIHEHAQWDLPAITAKPSKYDDAISKN